MSIEVKNLLKVYGEQKAVDHISFKAHKGEIVGFLGPNGAGKSTTLKIITGYLRQDAGEAFVCNMKVDACPLEIKKRTGYLPESNALYPEMYVREFLSFIAEMHKIRNHKLKTDEVLELTGLGRESKKKIGQLSKGYKQRVGLAAALIHDPEVLILDEPTSGLDPNQIIEIRNVIKQLGKNKTVLFSSHILQEVESICDRVIIINKGKLVADNTLASLRRQSASNSVRVTFKENAETEWLSRLPAVTSVKKTGDTGWQLDTENPDLLKKQILELALEKSLNVVSLLSENQSLEEVFRLLTTKPDNPPD